MDEYKSNSHKTRDGEITESIPEKRIERVTTGKTMIQKQTGFGKFMKSMVAEDARNVGSYILSDVLVPALKKAIMDVVTNGIDMLLYGKVQSRSSTPGITKYSYGNYYTGSRFAVDDYPSTQPSSNSISLMDYDNVIFTEIGDAEAALVTLDEIMDQYHVVSVGDFYEAAGISSYPYTVNKYGWTNIRNAKVVRNFDHTYSIRLPKPSPIS